MRWRASGRLSLPTETRLQKSCRSGWKAFSTIKGIYRGKRCANNLLKSIALLAMLCTSEMLTTTNKEDQTVYATENYGKMGISWSEDIRSVVSWEESREKDLIVEYRQQADSCSCRVVNEKHETSIWKTYAIIRWNCLAIRTNMEKSEIEDKMEAYWGQ